MQIFLFWKRAKYQSNWKMALKFLFLMHFMLLVSITICWVWDNCWKKAITWEPSRILHNGWRAWEIYSQDKDDYKLTFPIENSTRKIFLRPDDNCWWHTCFGHYHFFGLNYLSRKEPVPSLLVEIPNCICENS